MPSGLVQTKRLKTVAFWYLIYSNFERSIPAYMLLLQRNYAQKGFKNCPPGFELKYWLIGGFIEIGGFIFPYSQSSVRILLLCLKKIYFQQTFNSWNNKCIPLLSSSDFLFFCLFVDALFGVSTLSSFHSWTRVNCLELNGLVLSNLPVGPRLQDASFFLTGISRFQLSLLFGCSPLDMKSLIQMICQAKV